MPPVPEQVGNLLSGESSPQQFAALTDAAAIQREFAEGCDASATCDTTRFPLSTEVRRPSTDETAGLGAG